MLAHLSLSPRLLVSLNLACLDGDRTDVRSSLAVGEEAGVVTGRCDGAEGEGGCFHERYCRGARSVVSLVDSGGQSAWI